MQADGDQLVAGKRIGFIKGLLGGPVKRCRYLFALWLGGVAVFARRLFQVWPARSTRGLVLLEFDRFAPGLLILTPLSGETWAMCAEMGRISLA